MRSGDLEVEVRTKELILSGDISGNCVPSDQSHADQRHTGFVSYCGCSTVLPVNRITLIMKNSDDKYRIIIYPEKDFIGEAGMKAYHANALCRKRMRIRIVQNVLNGFIVEITKQVGGLLS